MSPPDIAEVPPPIAAASSTSTSAPASAASIAALAPAQPSPTTTTDPLVVSITIYSGLPDPVFVPTPDERARLLDLLDRLQPADPSFTPPPNQLGFRGFDVSGLAPAGAVGGRYAIRVWGSSVRIEGYDTTTYADRGSVDRTDPAGALWALLLEMTEAHLDELAPHDGRFTPAFVDELRAQSPG